jgi:hypothetical protein
MNVVIEIEQLVSFAAKNTKCKYMVLISLHVGELLHICFGRNLTVTVGYLKSSHWVSIIGISGPRKVTEFGRSKVSVDRLEDLWWWW